jgi:hypothetical protein
LGTALFFDDPKNNQGFFYYGPLKICLTDGRVCGLSRQSPKKGLQGKDERKIRLDGFRIGQTNID